MICLPDLGLLAAMICANGTPAPVPPPLDPTAAISGDLKVGLYRPRLVGDARLGLGRTIALDNTLRLDDAEEILNVELTLNRQNFWHVRISGFDFSTETRANAIRPGRFGAVTLAPGQAYHGVFDLTTVSLEWGADLFRPVGVGRRVDSASTDLRFTPYVGARWLSVENTLETDLARDGSTSAWVALSAGLQFQLRYEPEGGLSGFGHALDFEAGAAVGYAFGGDGGTALQIHANATWEVTPALGLFFGYRLVGVYADDDDYRLEASLQGLFVGASLRW